MISAGAHGAVSWVDLSTPDATMSVDFYRDLFGWSVEASSTPTGDYYIGSVGDHQVGGMMEQGPKLKGTPATWTTFFYTDDIEATVTAAEQAGGTVHEKPFEIPGGALIAIVADPTGAMFGLFGGPELEGVFYSQAPGAVCWVELLTRDPVAAETFYAAVFGWKTETRDAGGTLYTMFELDGERVAGMMMMPDAVPAEAPAHWSPYFAVVNCQATEDTLLELGGQVLRPTAVIDIGRFAVVADLHGAKFNLMEYADY